MAFRIAFWPYDHEFLTATVGTNDGSLLHELERLATERMNYNPDGADVWGRGLQLARCVVEQGFPQRGHFREEDHHRRAVDLLVISCVLQRDLPCSHDFRYLDLLDTLPIDISAFQSLENILGYGRPWFGASCPDEHTYGTLGRDEVRFFAEHCKESQSEFDEPEWDVDPLVDVFQVAIDNECDLWFGI